MKDGQQIVSLSDYAKISASKGHLRIAVPSWRSVNGNMFADAKPDQLLSREEIQRLFHGDLFQRTLTFRSQKRSGLTYAEKQEKSVSMRLREALYPDVRSNWRH